MDELVINPMVKQAWRRFVARPSHALLISGPPGAGKGTVAKHLMAELLAVEPHKLASYQYYLSITPQDGTISINTIRQLQAFMKLRTTGQRPLRRAILIEDAQAMTTEAQNAFLKLLEEPPADTVIIMTATSPRDLLPTVVSRTQQIRLKAPAREELEEYFKAKGYSSARIERSYYIAEGQPGLMASLLQDDSSHPLLSQITAAKRLLSASSFDRLTEIDALARQKNELPLLLLALRRVGHAALLQAIDKQQANAIKRWHAALRRLIKAEASLASNPQPKLLLTDLLLNL